MINNRSIAQQKPLSQLVLAGQACYAHRAKGEPLETIFKLGFGDWSPMPSAKMPARRAPAATAAFQRGHFA